MPQRSWTSSIARFALAVLLVGLALQWLHGVLAQAWPTLLFLLAVAIVFAISAGFMRHRDRW